MTTDYQHDDEFAQPPAAPDVPPPPPDAPLAEDAAAERARLLAEMQRLQAQIAATLPTVVDDQSPYELKTWMGYPIFCCRYCEWTTFDQALAEDHFSDGRYFASHQRSPEFVAAWGDTPPPPIPDA